MSQCRWCGKRTLPLMLDQDGLCRTCRPNISAEIAKLLNSVEQSRKIVENASNRALQIQHCRSIIEDAGKLRRFAERGIDVPGESSDALISEFRARHDTLAMAELASPDSCIKDIARAERMLAPYQDMLGIRSVLDSLRALKALSPRTHKTPVISLINQKGGVGKTTSSLNLGAGLAQHNKRVLLIDLDPQANLTDGLGIDEAHLKKTIFSVMRGDIAAEEAIVDISDRISIIPADVSLSRAEKELAKEPSNVFLVKKQVETLLAFDYIIIDCPPSLGVLTLNALAASDRMIIPVQPEYYALKGIRKVFDALEFINRKINRDLRIMGFIGTRYDARKKLHKEVVEKIRNGINHGAFFTVVRENIAIAEATSYGKSIFEYSPDSPGAEDYMLLTEKVLEVMEPLGDGAE